MLEKFDLLREAYGEAKGNAILYKPRSSSMVVSACLQMR